jgi:hypothetical protein
MLNNNFANAPTVGSHDATPTIDSLHARMQHLEQLLLAMSESRRSAYNNEQQRIDDDEQPAPKKAPKKGKLLGKIRKFFSSVIVPILNLVPRFINALAKFREADASLRDAKTRAKKLKKAIA